MARPRGHGPGADGDIRAALHLGRDAVGVEKGLAGRARRSSTSSPSTTASSATSCGFLAGEGCKITVVPATTSAEDILAMKPDGVFLSNGPGDPPKPANDVPVIRESDEIEHPDFGICLGHQMLGLAVGGRNRRWTFRPSRRQSPVKDETTGKAEITSMNHGFAVDQATLPAGATQTHISLFDGSNCGISLDGRPVFSVQYHPEASPGPRDSHYLFRRFADLMRAKKGG